MNFPRLSMPNEKLQRLIVIVSLASALSMLVTWAARDIATTATQERIVASDRLREFGQVVTILYLAEEKSVDDLMERLRIEIRAQGLWLDADVVDALSTTVNERAEIDARRLHALLRRALSSNLNVSMLELVIAGHDGLSTVRLERGAGGESARDLDPRVQEGFAKALWYADEVSRAVSSAGRRVERGDLSFEEVDDGERPIVRVAIGLQEPGELVQGAIVVSIDMGDFGSRLEAISGPRARLAMVMPDGRRLTSSSANVAPDARIASLSSRIMGTVEAPEVFDADGQLVYGLRMVHADGGSANLLALIEATEPLDGLSAWLDTPWPLCLGAMVLLSSGAIWGLFRSSGRVVDDSGNATELSREVGLRSDTSTMNDGIAITAGTEIEIVRAPFALRDLLADVRGCLEREAATRGLALDLRCERSLPNQVDSDPAWLGGLLVAIGREALDATSGERISVEVLEDVGESLRFEVAGGGVELGPAHGMQEVALRIGGYFEQASEGKVALVLENGLIAPS